METVAPFYHLLASPNIESMKDAVDKGAVAGVSGIGSLDYAMTRYLFKRAGLDPDKIKYVQAGTPGQRTAALEAGRVQLAISAYPRNTPCSAVARCARSPRCRTTRRISPWKCSGARKSTSPGMRRPCVASSPPWTTPRYGYAPRPTRRLPSREFIGLNYPEGPEDVKEALREVALPDGGRAQGEPDRIAVGYRAARGGRARTRHPQSGNAAARWWSSSSTCAMSNSGAAVSAGRCSVRPAWWFPRPLATRRFSWR